MRSLQFKISRRASALIIIVALTAAIGAGYLVASKANPSSYNYYSPPSSQWGAGHTWYSYDCYLLDYYTNNALSSGGQLNIPQQYGQSCVGMPSAPGTYKPSAGWGSNLLFPSQSCFNEAQSLYQVSSWQYQQVNTNPWACTVTGSGGSSNNSNGQGSSSVNPYGQVSPTVQSVTAVGANGGVKSGGGSSNGSGSTSSGGAGNQVSGSSSSTNVSPSSYFNTSGNKIIDSTDNQFVPYGISVMADLQQSDWCKAHNQQATDAQIKAAAEYWYANTIRLQVAEANFVGGHTCTTDDGRTVGAFQALARLLQEVNQIENLGLIPMVNDNTEFTGYSAGPTATTATFWQELTAVLASQGATNYSNVIFDIYNEPSLDGGNWQAAMQSIVNSIRNGPNLHNNLIVIEGMGPNRATSLENIGRYVVSGTNLAYAYHHVNLDHSVSDWKQKMGLYSGVNAPIIDGEWSQYASYRHYECYETAPKNVPTYFDLLSDNSIGLIFWSLEPGVGTINGRTAYPVSDTLTATFPTNINGYITPNSFGKDYRCQGGRDTPLLGQGAGTKVMKYFLKMSTSGHTSSGGGSGGGGNGGGGSGSGFSSVADLNAGSCLDDPYGSTANGERIQQWDCWGPVQQHWQFVPATSNGFFEIINQASGKCLDVRNGSTANGGMVQQWGCWDGPQQQWKPVATTTAGYYELVNLNSGMCLDVPNAATDNGLKIQQWGCWGGSQQLWTGSAVSAAYSEANTSGSGGGGGGSSGSGGSGGNYSYYTPTSGWGAGSTWYSYDCYLLDFYTHYGDDQDAKKYDQSCQGIEGASGAYTPTSEWGVGLTFPSYDCYIVAFYVNYDVLSTAQQYSCQSGPPPSSSTYAPTERSLSSPELSFQNSSRQASIELLSSVKSIVKPEPITLNAARAVKVEFDHKANILTNGDLMTISQPITIAPALLKLNGIKDVRYFVNGSIGASVDKSPFAYVFNSPPLSKGNYRVLVETDFSNGKLNRAAVIFQVIQPKNLNLARLYWGLAIGLPLDAVVCALLYIRYIRQPKW